MSKPVLVVGGGPAGLSAAHSLASVGQKVVLVEKEDRLGGAPILSGYAKLAPSFEWAKDAIGPMVDRVVNSANVEVVSGTTVKDFSGEPGNFTRTPHRRDFAIAPPKPALMDWAQADGRVVHAIGKIGDIFSHRGVSHLHKGKNDADLVQHLLRLADEAEDGSLTFCNLVEFDSLYGHPRDVDGYAQALETVDLAVAEFLARLRPGDLALFTADHGNDPTWSGTDHTRERVPVLVAGAGAGEIGLCAFVDVAASVAGHLGLTERGPGRSFL